MIYKLLLTFICFLLLLVTPALFAAKAQTANPWLQTYPAPTRILYVSPTGTAGAAGSVASPLSLSAAVGNAQPGDLYLLQDGIYTSGVLIFSKVGTATKPIVFRASNTNKATLIGKHGIQGAHTWLWGLEFINPDYVSVDGDPDAMVSVRAAGVHLINNLIHDGCDSNGIGGWDTGSGQVYYGNIFYGNGCNPTLLSDGSRLRHPHNIYTQNNYETNGYKYYVNNMIFETGCSNNCYSLHAYTEGGNLSGFHFEKNIFANTLTTTSIAVLLGGTNYSKAEHHNAFIDNYFYRAGARLGYRDINQAEFRNNYLGRSFLSANYFWGVGDTKFTKTAPNLFTGNYLINPASGTHIELRTAAFTSSTAVPSLGLPKLDSSDIFNNNFYSAPFKGTLEANGLRSSGINFVTWKAQTAAAGKGFDVNSTEVSVPTTAKVAVLPNEYEAGRGHIAIYNWGNQTNVQVDLSSVLTNGSSFKIVNAKDVNGIPVVSGTYSSPVTVPTAEQEFLPLVVVRTGAAQATPTPTSCVGDINGDNSVNLTDYSLLVQSFLKIPVVNVKADINQDGVVNLQDYSMLVSKFLKPCS